MENRTYVLGSKEPLLTTSDFAKDSFSFWENSLKSVTAAETKGVDQTPVIAASCSIAVWFHWPLYLTVLLGW